MPGWGGQFGTPGAATGLFPMSQIKQYPGTQNMEESYGLYTNLLAGPYSNAYNITAAQADDPEAMKYQGAAAGGGGAFASPGAMTRQLGSLFGAQGQGYVAGQGAKQQQQTQSGKGILQTLQDYATDQYTTQSAANQLEEAKLQAQEQEQQAAIQLGSMVATLATGNPAFMEIGGVVSGTGSGGASAGGIGGLNVSGANAVAGLGGQNTMAPGYTGGPFSGGLYGRWFGTGAGGAPTGPTSGTLMPVDNSGMSSVDQYYNAGVY